MFKKIIRIISAIIFFCAIGAAVWLGILYLRADAAHKRFVAAEYARACLYQELAIRSRYNIADLVRQRERDLSDYQRLRAALERERQNNRKLADILKRIGESEQRAEERERAAIGIIDRTGN